MAAPPPHPNAFLPVRRGLRPVTIEVLSERQMNAWGEAHDPRDPEGPLVVEVLVRRAPRPKKMMLRKKMPVRPPTTRINLLQMR